MRPDALPELLDLVDKGVLTSTVDRVFPLKDAPAAHVYLEHRQVRGKVALVTEAFA